MLSRRLEKKFWSTWNRPAEERADRFLKIARINCLRPFSPGHHKNGNGRLPDDFFGHASQECVFYSCSAVRAYHDYVNSFFPGEFQNFFVFAAGLTPAEADGAVGQHRFAVGVEGTSNSIAGPRSEYSNPSDAVEMHKEWDRFLGLALKARIGSWKGFSIDPRLSFGRTWQDGQRVTVAQAFGEDAMPPEEVPTVPDDPDDGPEIPLPPTQNEDGEWEPGGTRPATSEDINSADLQDFDIDSSGYQVKPGVDLTWMAWDWIGIFAGPTLYRMWGDYETSNQHNLAAPHADLRNYSRLTRYDETGWGGRVGLTLRPLASIGSPVGVEINPFYEEAAQNLIILGESRGK